MKVFKYLLFFGILLVPARGFAASPSEAVAKGNRLYQKGKFDEAFEQYQKAGGGIKDSDAVNFNSGAALYKKGDYEKAAQFFTRALATDKKDLEAKANFNIAGSKYKLAVSREKTDLKGAVGLLKESLGHYAKTIELSPEDKDARYNYELTDRKLKALTEELKKQPPKQCPNPDNKKDGGGKQEKQQEAQEDGKKGQGQQAQAGKEKEKNGKDEAAGKEAARNDKEKENRENAAARNKTAEEDAKEMSRREARMLLDGYHDNEQYWGMVDNRTRESGSYAEPQKDW